MPRVRNATVLSHGRNFNLIDFKFEDKTQKGYPMFTNENQRDWLITSGDTAKRISLNFKILSRTLTIWNSSRQGAHPKQLRPEEPELIVLSRFG